MGRGRAKAKQIKVARKLKYSTPDTDLSALERELHASRGEPYGDDADGDELDEDDAYAGDDEDDDEEGGHSAWASGDDR